MTSGDRLTIRLAQLEDADILTRFSAAMALETEKRTLDLARLRLGTVAVLESQERGFFSVAEISQNTSRTVVGQLLVTYEWSDWRNASFWWIQSVYVDPAWRRRGVYRRMHEAIVRQAKSRNDACGIRLYVEKDNAVAQSVYKAMKLQPTRYAIWEVDFVL